MYTEEQLKDWISIRLNKSVKSLTTSIRNSKEIQKALLLYTIEHNDLTYSARANIVYKGSRPKCVVCNNDTYFNRNRWEFGETCSVKCAANNVRRNNQIKNTTIEKYGVDNISKSNLFKDGMKTHNLEKYGVEHYFQTSDYKEKNLKTCQERYGVDSFTQTKEFREKYIKTCQERYGENSYSKTEDFKKKIKLTCQLKYGVDHHMQNLEIFEKQQKNSYYFKDYIMPSGKIVRIQGYEDRALDELLKIYNEEDIIISNHEIYEKFGFFEYNLKNKKHRYYPDLYLIPENKFIEVKSTRTFSVNKKINLLKRDCVKLKGFNFSFWIYGKEKEKEIL